MKEDQEFLKSIFAGDNTAFLRFHKEFKVLFEAYFHKHYPYTKVSIEDLYQDSIMELWSKIVDGRLTEDGLTCPLSSYVIGIGVNKLREESRSLAKIFKLKKGEPVFKKRRSAADTVEDEEREEDTKLFPLQSKRQQKELAKSINEALYSFQRKEQITPYDDESDYAERLREWSDFLQKKYEELGFPCNQLLRATWYNNMTDNEIYESFDGYFANTNVIKSKRYKCHKALLNMFNAWKNAQE